LQASGLIGLTKSGGQLTKKPNVVVILVAVVIVCIVHVQTLAADCKQYVSEHQDYEASCQLARDWLVVARDQLDTCVNVVGDEQHLEAAKNVLMVGVWSFILCALQLSQH